MSTVAPKPPPSPRPPHTPAFVDSEGYIDEHISRTRRALKLVDLSAGLLSLAVAVLAFLLAAAVLDQWVVPGGLGALGRGVLFGALVVVIAWFGWRQFVPLLKSINPVYAAHTIERTTPSLKNSLLNLLLFRTHRQQMSAKVYHALEQQAAQRLSVSTADATVDHSALLRLGYALLAVVAVCALYSVLSPKNLAVSAARILAPWSELAAPTRVQILAIQPGDTAVARGERLTVTAEVHGARRDEPVRLRYSTADEQTVDESVAMTRPADGVRFEGQVPRPADAGGATGVMQQLEYWLEAGDAQSRHYKVAVFDRPTLVVERVRYEFPTYTGIPSAEVAGTGDLRGLEGTRVTLRAIASQPIKNAAIDFDGDGSSDLKMSVEGDQADRAVASFVLALRDDRRTPAHPTYVLRLETTAGRKNADPAQYRIEVTPDYAPEVRITRPEEAELAVRADQVVPIGVEARDPDFAVEQVRLVGRAGDRDVLIGDLLDKNHEGRVTAAKLFTPADAQLKAGDVLEYWAEARDNRRPEPNIGLSEHRRLKIVGAPDQPNQQQPGKNGQQGRKQGNDQSPDGQSQDGQQGGQQQQGGDKQQGQQGGADGQAGQPGEQGASNSSDKNEGKQNDKTGGQQSAPGGSGEGDNKSDQETAKGGGAGQSGKDQKPSDAAGASGDQSQPGQEGQQPPTSQQQPGEQQAGGQSGKGDKPDSAKAQPSKVSPEGDDDGSAFQRMNDHFAQQDVKNQTGGKPQPGEQQQPGGSDATAKQDANQQSKQSNDAQPSANAQQKPGAQQQSKSNQQSGAAGANSKTNAQQQPSAGQSGEPPSSGEGKTQPQPGAQDPNQRRAAGKAQESKTGDGNPGQEQAGEKPAADSVANNNQGDAGSGHASDEDQGAPGLDESAKKASDKTDADNGKTKGDQEPPSGSPDKRESNSRGSTGGDASGGGQQGAGQKADAAGKGDAGQHEAADQGAGKAAEKGDGQTGDKAGDQQQADGKTGQSSGDKPGAGSQSREGEQPGAGEKSAASGDSPAEDADDKSAQQSGSKPNDQATAKPGEQGDQQSGQQPGQQSGDQAGQKPGEQSGDQAGKKPGDKSGEQSGKQSAAAAEGAAPSDQSTGNQSSPQSSPQGGNSSAQPQAGGGRHGDQAGPEQPSAPEVADKANLDYARQQTDLILERLDQQLAKKKVDPDLLKSLGWNDDELRRFVERWQGLKSRAAADPDFQQKLDAALRSLGLRNDGPLRFRAGSTADQVRDLNEAYRARAPLEYSERVRAYVKGAAGDDAQK